MNIVQVVKPARNILFSPVRPDAVKVTVIVRVPLVEAHSVFFGKVADDG